MTFSKTYLKLLRGGIFISLFLPLVIFSQYLSPFHFGKMILFRTLVEVMAVIYILLIIANKKYLPQWTPILTTFTVFVGLYALASLNAVDFNYAFWGTLERMGGLFSFLHFWVFFIILVSVIRNRDNWEKILKVSVFVGFLSILFAIGQYFKLGNFFVGWQHGERVIGTIGNPALFAGYLLFILFLSIYFLLKKEISSKEKGFHASVLILGTSVILITAVRGSVIAFFGALFFLALFYFVLQKNKKIKRNIFIGLVIFLALIVFVYLNSGQSWVKNFGWLDRITSISFETDTVQTRLWSWQSGFQGWKEKPLLGWGPENFVLAHAKHFNPLHFTSIGSETIWDRAHNIILEMLTTMGVLGLLSYLSIFIMVYYLLIKNFKEKKIKINTIGALGAMLFAYFVHNLFIFDTAANYFMFFLILAFINFICSRDKYAQADTEINIEKEKRPNPALMVFLMILAIVCIYKTNIEPARANYACTRAILAGRMGKTENAFDKYKEALSYKSLQGKYEIRHKLATFIIQYNDNLRQEDKKLDREALYYAIREIEKNVENHPFDYVPYLYIGRMYILLISEESEVFGEKAEAAIKEALDLNDKNPRIWYELGQAQLSQKKFNEAIESFEGALKLNPEVGESNWFLGMTYAQAGDTEQAIKYIDQALKLGYAYKNKLKNLIHLINLYGKSGDYYKVITYYKEAIELRPKNAQFHASIAAAYKAIGDTENAILYAQKAAEIDPEKFKVGSDEFINSLK